MKKILLGLGATIAVISPIITVVSCGMDSKKEQKIKKNYSLVTKTLSQGIEIDGNKISIDFSIANEESSDFARDMLNFFNDNKGQKVILAFTNSHFEKINNHEVEMRVSINGYDDYTKLNADIEKIDESYIDLTPKNLANYEDLNDESTFRDIAFENAEASRQEMARQAELIHNQTWNNYLAKWNEANAINLAVPNDKRANGNPPIKPTLLPQTTTVDALNNGINALSTFIAQAHAFISTFHYYAVSVSVYTRPFENDHRICDGPIYVGTETVEETKMSNGVITLKILKRDIKQVPTIGNRWNIHF